MAVMMVQAVGVRKKMNSSCVAAVYQALCEALDPFRSSFVDPFGFSVSLVVLSLFYK